MKKLTTIQRFAKGKPCMLRIPGVCRTTPDNEDTCLCHAPFPNRGGMREADWWGSVGCHACHAYIDKRMYIGATVPVIERHWLPAIHEWQAALIEVGLIKVDGYEPGLPKLLKRR